MAKKSRSGNSYKQQYQAYKLENRWKKNKLKKLERRILANPNDVGAEQAMEVVSKKVYGRKKPGQKGWFHPQEQALLKDLRSEVASIQENAKRKLNNLRSVYSDSRPTAARINIIPEPNETVADQLHNIGYISEKRRNFINSRMGSVRQR
jgi:hypothetical protein